MKSAERPNGCLVVISVKGLPLALGLPASVPVRLPFHPWGLADTRRWPPLAFSPTQRWLHGESLSR